MTTTSGVPGFRHLLILLLAMGVVLTATVVPGVFTTDDNNYLVNVLALRQGRITIAQSEGLTPSRELLFFDPAAWSRAVDTTPVASTAPPLYAPIALPFALFGWRGLVVLNTLAYLAAVAMVFAYAARYSSDPLTPWFAAAAVGLGGYLIEYAQGVWPHGLSIALCTAGILYAGRAIEDERPSYAVASGLLLAVATGVRYQNAALLAATGAGLLFLARNRLKAAAAFMLAAFPPIAVVSVVNHLRLDSWNPISKGPGYLSIAPQGRVGSVLDRLVMFWARVVDFSIRPPQTGPFSEAWVTYDPTTGAHLMMGVTSQKSLLQSAPWVVVALIAFVLAWSPWSSLDASQRRQLRLLSLPFFALIGTFAVAGVDRSEGLAFNQRYLLELLPLAAIAFAWSLDKRRLSLRSFQIGAVIGGMLVLIIILGTPIGGGPGVPLWVARQLAIFEVPLVLAAIVGTAWLLDRFGYKARLPLAAAAGACLAWGLMLHLSHDLVTSRWRRGLNLARTETLAEVLPNRSALVTYWGMKDAAVPLLFDHDLIILDAHADGGRDAPILIREVLR
ncbi:MAG: hypothetical protein AB7P22_09390, partial [Vicinamibacterales bacterium]